MESTVGAGDFAGTDNLKRIVSTVSDGIVVVDRQGQVLFVNESACSIFGERPLLGRNLGIPLTPDGTYQDVQVVLNGRVGWAELRTSPIEWNGRPAILGSFRDITARKQAEAALQALNTELEERVRERTQNLVELNEELESFAYSVSHDLRAPLRAIDGLSRILQEDHAGQLDAEGLRQLQIIRDSTRRMGQMIDDLLEFSRMGRKEMLLRPLDMNGMVRNVIEELRAAEPPDRAIDFVLSPLPPIQGDAALLRHVWCNLLSNAIKYTRECTRARVEIGGRVDGAEAVFWVRDNGSGFNMQSAGKLFGVFQRLHPPGKFEGTGVGLAITRRIVARHGGRIWGEGEPGAGAVFWFALPVAAVQPVPATDSGG